MDYFKNYYNTNLGDVFSAQKEFVQQATEINKKLAIEVLKSAQTVAEAYSKAVGDSIKSLSK